MAGLMSRVAMLSAVVVLVSACTLNQHGPWVDANGQQLQGSEMVEFDGFAACDWEKVVFIRLFGEQYAKDPEGVLGELRSPDTGDVVAFEVLASLPEGLEATGFTHAGRELYLGDDRPDYIYIRLPNGQVERWPRAEVECVRDR